MELFGAILGRPGAILGLSWAILGHVGAILGHRAVLGLARLGLLGPSWAILGYFGTILGPLGAILKLSWGHLEANLGLSWVQMVHGRLILAETGFVYELSEGLTELQKIIRVCQKEEIAA